MNARRIAVCIVVWPAIEQPIVCASGHQLSIAPCRLTKPRLMLRHKHQPRVASVTGPAPPPTPLIVACPPTVVPRAIRQHELQMSLHRSNHDVPHHRIFGQHTVECQRRQRFLHVVPQVHRPARLGCHSAQRMPLTKQESVRRKLAQRLVRQSAPPLHIVLVPQHPPAQHKRQRSRHRVIDISRFDSDESIQKLRSPRQPLGPPFLHRCIQNCSVMFQRLRQRNCVEYRDSLPGTQRNVVHPTAVRPAHRTFRPLMHLERRA